MPSTHNEGSGHPGPSAEHSPNPSPIGFRIGEFRALDADGLQAYAWRPVDPEAPDPIGPFVRVAFNIESSISSDKAVPLLRQVGTQINEPNVSPTLATLLRLATDEAVYSNRLTSEQGWNLMASLFGMHGKYVRNRAARVAVASTGLDRRTLTRALGLEYKTVQTDTTWLANAIRRDPEAHEQLVQEAIAAMGPLVLPELEPRIQQREHLTFALGHILLGEEVAPEVLELYNETTTSQQAAIVEALSIRYLDKPLIRSSVEEPWDLISSFRRYCSGEAMASIVRSEGDGLVQSRVKGLYRALHNAMTPEDIVKMKQFVAGETETLVLDRYERRRSQ